MNLRQIKAILDSSLHMVDPEWGLQPGSRRKDGSRADANETAVMAKQLEYFFPKLWEVEYPASRGRQLVPIDYSVPSGADSHKYVIMDKIGEAGVIASYAADLPLVDEFGTETIKRCFGFGAGFFISLQDLRAAAFLGRDIDARKAMAVREIMDRKLDQLICTGDDAQSITGFANDSNVPVKTGLNGTWATASAEQIKEDLQTLGKVIFLATKGVRGAPDNGTKITLAMPPSLFAIITSTEKSQFSDKSIYRWILDNNPYIGDIQSWGRLETAGADSGPRIVGYQKDPNVLSTIIPQEFEILPMQPKGLGYMVPTHMRFGGVTVRYPLAMFYNDECG